MKKILLNNRLLHVSEYKILLCSDVKIPRTFEKIYVSENHSVIIFSKDK